MTQDAFIPPGHFGTGLDTYSALVTGVKPGNNLEYCYQMYKSSTNEEVSNPEIMKDVIDDKPYKRTMRVGERRLYAVDDFQVRSHDAYKRIASKSGNSSISYTRRGRPPPHSSYLP